jgi:hypothetical protein
MQFPHSQLVWNLPLAQFPAAGMRPPDATPQDFVSVPKCESQPEVSQSAEVFVR